MYILIKKTYMLVHYLDCENLHLLFVFIRSFLNFLQLLYTMLKVLIYVCKILKY